MLEGQPFPSVVTASHQRMPHAYPLAAVALILAACADETGMTAPELPDARMPDARELIVTTTEDTPTCEPPPGACSLRAALELASRDLKGGPYTIVLADDPTFRITLPGLGESGRGRADESAFVIEDAGTIVGQSLSTGALMRRDGQPAGGGWRHDWNDGTQTGDQDVYFLDDDGSLRNPDGESPDDAPLYNLAGVPLEMTWGEYRGAEARSLLIVSPGDEPTSTFIVNMKGLVPGGVYSLFYTTFFPDSENPFCPNALRDLPLTSIVPDWQPPDPSSFTADRRGSALYIGQVEGDVLAASLSSVQVIYHADGETYHPLPNRGAFETHDTARCRSSYGVDAMRHLFILQKWDF